jgi:FKBP-type peptidyl-prolyl cis-trans isomerase
MLNRIAFLLLLAAFSGVYAGFAAGADTAPAATPNAAAAPASTVDDATRGQYALGYQLGRELATTPDRTQAMMDGVRDGRSGAAPKYTEQEMQAALQALGQQINEQRAKVAAAEAEKQGAASAAFLAENAKKPGVQTTASGLQYKVLQPGTGKQPKADDTVTVNYRGTLLDGTEFDSSYKRGQPATFAVNGVIAGWTEALQLMKEGAKYQLFIPANLAYGDRGPLANRLLIFDVELLNVGAAQTPK